MSHSRWPTSMSCHPSKLLWPPTPGQYSLITVLSDSNAGVARQWPCISHAAIRHAQGSSSSSDGASNKCPKLFRQMNNSDIVKANQAGDDRTLTKYHPFKRPPQMHVQHIATACRNLCKQGDWEQSPAPCNC